MANKLSILGIPMPGGAPAGGKEESPTGTSNVYKVIKQTCRRLIGFTVDKIDRNYQS